MERDVPIDSYPVPDKGAYDRSCDRIRASQRQRSVRSVNAACERRVCGAIDIRAGGNRMGAVSVGRLPADATAASAHAASCSATRPVR